VVGAVGAAVSSSIGSWVRNRSGSGAEPNEAVKYLRGSGIWSPTVPEQMRAGDAEGGMGSAAEEDGRANGGHMVEQCCGGGAVAADNHQGSSGSEEEVDF